MAPRPTFEVDSWDAALALVRHDVPGAEVAVSKRAEPILPPELPVRRSNVPWSVHKGARRVYREDRPGEHVQIREYPDRWTVQLDSSNPHYRPVRHVVLDTGPYARTVFANPLGTTSDALLYGPVRTLQFSAQLAADGMSAMGRLLRPVVPTSPSEGAG